MPDPRDLSHEFNTPLSPQEEQAFQSWATKSGRAGDVYDYDLRGAWKTNSQEASNGHLPDTFKKPNHPTFSNESVYNGQHGFQGGQWQETEPGKWSFTPGPTNLHWRKPEDLQQYFKEREPNAVLILP